MTDITSQVACNVTNANNIHYQNKTVKSMTYITIYVAFNVTNANNIHNQNKITLM